MLVMASSNETALIEGLFGVALVTRAEVAAAALFTWDYLFTLGMEIDLVWNSRWNTIKILFLVQRYLPFIDTCILTLYRDLLPGRTSHGCNHIEKATGFLYVAGYAVSEILLTMRVWAVWNRSKRLAIVLPIVYIVVWTPAFVAMYYFVTSLQFAPPPPGVTGCFIIFAKDVVKWCWVSLIIWNAFTLTLMLIPGLRDYRTKLHSSLLVAVIYRDGTFYFLYLFVLSLLNILLSVELVPTKRFVISSLERCLHAMLASRVIFHMRDYARQQAEWELTGLSEGGELQFAPARNRQVVTTVLQVDREILR